MPEPARRFLVTTDHGDVVVTVNDQADGLDPGLLSLAMADEGTSKELPMATPLRAFAAKMVDLIEAQGFGAFAGGERMREMLVREKATADLRRIERFAREHGGS
ncbi:MAG: hypothetical protein P8Y13_15665 [Deinococcales bacterium]|jgi:hypothetical protein